jgi:uncharacterized protein
MQHSFPPSEQRYSLLDALRGFAIFGIFGVNMVASSFSWFPGGDESWLRLGKADEWFQVFLDTMIEGKFYSIFSLLFGIGFGLQLQKHADNGVDGLPIFKRRLWGLLLIGFLHMMFLWLGDIVFLYAWLGFVLIAFRHKSDRYILWAALFCLAMPVLLYPLRFINKDITLGIPFYLASWGTGKLLGVDVTTVNPAEMMSAPGWGNYFRSNVLGFVFRQADLFDQVRPFKVFSMFLVGMWVSRHRWYQSPQVFLNRFRKWVPYVLPASILVNVAMALISWDDYYGAQLTGWLKTLLYFLGVVPLSLCYVYMFTSGYLSGKYNWLHTFSWVGRMALSNYLFHSVLYVIIFRGPFLAMAGKVGPLACMVPVLIIFPLQILFSKWWLKTYRYGPAEWLWRSMTYGKWQPLKRVVNGN